MFWTNVVEKLKTHILCSVTFCRKSYLLWNNVEKKNIVERGRPRITIWRMCIACWIPKATNTHSLCNTHCFSTATVVAWKHLHFTLYVVHWLSSYACSRHTYRTLLKFYLFLISNFRRVLHLVCILFGYFPGVWLWFADVSEHSICSIFKGWMWSMNLKIREDIPKSFTI